MSIEDEVNKLNIDIREIDEWLGCQHVVQAGNQAWCHDNFEVVLNSYVATRRIAKQYGVEIPPVDYEGLTEVEILTKCLVQTEEIQSLRLILHQKASVLGAELRVKNVFSRQIDELDEDTDFLALRSEDRTIVVGLIAKIRLEVTNAEWMEDKHRVRVLKKLVESRQKFCNHYRFISERLETSWILETHLVSLEIEANRHLIGSQS